MEEELSPQLPERDDQPYDAYEDTKYFEEYAKYSIHCDMLRDEARMDSYYNAILANKDALKGKVVLDVGCGSGVLACWCAKAGAKKVYAVEASSIAEQAKIIVARNGLHDIVEVIQGKLEDTKLPVSEVDVIISEWMGSFLVFESMLESVLWARDTYLAADGLMFPETARIYLAPINMQKYLDKNLLFLNKVKGLDMSPMIPFAKREYSNWTLRGQKVLDSELIRPSSENTHQVAELDLVTVTAESLKKFVTPFKFQSGEDGQTLHAFAAWFDVQFPKPDDAESAVVLSTSPKEKLTHWRQDVFFLYEEVELKKGSTIEGVLIMQQNGWWKRHYDAEFSFNVDGKEYYIKTSS